MMKITFTILSTLFLFSQSLFAQLDSIYDQGVYRDFIVHLPSGYSTSNQYPLVLNMHGLNSSAVHQQSYSQFDDIADSLRFIVVYPNAISNSWTTIGDSDVDFLSNLVDSIRTDYSCNNCLFVTGMSQGGFMTYKFANTTSHTVTAIAVGSGNMSNVLQNSSSSAPQIPVMHFHGTDDHLVSYDGTLLISPVDSTIQWWVKHNNCNANPVYTAIPNSNLADSSTVEKYYYGGGSNGSEVTFYKVLNGGHTWSGATPIPVFGHTNQDMSQSTIIGSYFSSFCPTITGVGKEKIKSSFRIYPSPFSNQLNVTTLNNEIKTLIFYDYLSHPVRKVTFSKWTTIDTDQLPNGIYFYELWNSDRQIESGKVIKN